MIRALLVAAMLAGCGGTATTVAPTVVATAETPRSETMCVAFEIVTSRIRPALVQAAGGDAVAGSLAALEIVTAGSDILDMAADAEGQEAADLTALGEAYQHQGSAVQAVAANPDLPAEDAEAGSELYVELVERYEC